MHTYIFKAPGRGSYFITMGPLLGKLFTPTVGI